MISPQYYRKANTVKNLVRGTAKHYPVKPGAIVLSTREYIITGSENLYDIAVKLFGENRQYMWTIIADINPPKMPDEWEAGDIILLPETIVQESAFLSR